MTKEKLQEVMALVIMTNELQDLIYQNQKAGQFDNVYLQERVDRLTAQIVALID